MFITTTLAVAALAAVVEGNTAFAVDLYRRQAAQQNGNIFFSPYSISTAMAMVDSGARGATAAEIEKTMHLPFGGKRLAGAWTSVLNDVQPIRGGYELVTANALWAARGTKFRSAYLETARADFAARIETLDFAHAADAARARINAWVSEATKQKIRSLIAQGMIDASTQLVLTNAIYMKAKWDHPFPTNATNKNGRFHAPGGETKASMMSLTSTFRLFHGQGLRILELPYAKQELSMLIVLPDANDGLPAIEKELTPQKLVEWEKKLIPTVVAVTFPRFNSEMSLDLGETLRAMGIRLAFDPHGAADFSGMTDTGKLAISRAIHKARVDVTEEGTEAAAATAVTMMPTAAIYPPSRPELFVADHPFLYLIRRNGSNSVLFVGRLMKP
jgi:serpin B